MVRFCMKFISSGTVTPKLLQELLFCEDWKSKFNPKNVVKNNFNHPPFPTPNTLLIGHVDF